MKYLIYFLFPCAVFAKDLPQGLLFEGKPLDPHCLESIAEGDSSRFGPHSLHQCSQFKNNIEIENSASDILGSQGFTGYYYHDKNHDDCKTNLCYSYWKNIAQVAPSQYLIWVESAGGGTGRFSSLFLMKREQDNIENILEFAGGDRSFRGIVDAQYHDSQIFVEQRATPAIIFNECLEKLNPTHNLLKQNSMLDCAICEAGVTFKKGNVQSKILTTYKIKLSDLSKDDYNNDASNSWQNCFNEVALKRVASGGQELNEKEMANFAQDVLNMCQKD